MSRIGIDVDGVLADFNVNYNALMAKYEGKDLNVPYVEPAEWSYEKALGYSKDAINKAWDEINAPESSFWATLPAYPEIHTFVKMIKEMREGNDVYFITTRTGATPKQQTERWFEYYGLYGATVLVSKHKGEVAAGLELDHMIDDKPENCVNVLQSRPQCEVVLLDRPWNQTFSHLYIKREVSLLKWLDSLVGVAV